LTAILHKTGMQTYAFCIPTYLPAKKSNPKENHHGMARPHQDHLAATTPSTLTTTITTPQRGFDDAAP
jgi:hypothetical protein